MAINTIKLVVRTILYMKKFSDAPYTNQDNAKHTTNVTTEHKTDEERACVYFLNKSIPDEITKTNSVVPNGNKSDEELFLGKLLRLVIEAYPVFTLSKG
jgi:hypothetical protein